MKRKIPDLSPIDVFKIGSSERPAYESDIKDFAETLDKARKEAKKNGLGLIVTHHLVKAQRTWIPVKKGKIISFDCVLVKVGTNERPAGEKDLEDIEKDFSKVLFGKGCEKMSFITHHAIDVSLIKI